MEINPLWMFVPFLAIMALGHPLGFGLGAAGMFFAWIFWGGGSLNSIPMKFIEIQESYLFMALPLFIYMGNILQASGATEKLYEALHHVFGPVRGGLAIGTILICTLFAAATGVMSAATVTMGTIALPEMVRRGYDKSFAVGTVMTAACLGILIPPSILLVVYGATAPLSVGRLFMAAVFPGLVLSGLYMGYVLIRCFLNKDVGPALPVEERTWSIPKKLGMVSVHLIPPLFLIVAVLGAILFGVATPTEAAALGALGATIIAAAYRKLNYQNVKSAVFRTARFTGMICLIAVGAYMFTSTFFALGGGREVAAIFDSMGLGRWGSIIVMQVIIFILGCLMDWVPILLIVIPVFTPLVTLYGFDPIWFAIITAVNIQAGFLTPPFGWSLFFMRGVTAEHCPEVTYTHEIKGIIPYVILIAIGVAIVCIFPQIALWLPAQMVKKPI